MLGGGGMLAVFLLCALGAAGPEESPGDRPAAAEVREKKPATRLRLGSFAYPSVPAPPSPPPAAVPRFDTHVEVNALARPDANATMAIFWRKWNLDDTAIYGRGIAVQDTKNGGFNVLPLVDWSLKKLKGRKTTSPPLDLDSAEESPSP
jgi:hypothetical protein